MSREGKCWVVEKYDKLNRSKGWQYFTGSRSRKYARFLVQEWRESPGRFHYRVRKYVRKEK